MMRKHLPVAVAALVFAACQHEPTGAVSSNELVLAQSGQIIADNVAASSTGGTNFEGWFRRALDTLRTTDNPVAKAYLDSARINRDSAWAAFARGDTTAARAFRKAAFRDVLSAVIALFPNAPQQTGAAVDTAVAKIDSLLGTRDAPRIRRLLAHVDTLRAEADSALKAGDNVTALALNLRSMQILHRLVEHVEHAEDSDRDHDERADHEMEDVGD